MFQGVREWEQLPKKPSGAPAVHHEKIISHSYHAVTATRDVFQDRLLKLWNRFRGEREQRVLAVPK
jgi:type VI protein secretion system component VasF